MTTGLVLGMLESEVTNFQLTWSWVPQGAQDVLPLIFIATRIFRKYVRDSYRRIRSAIARINAYTQEHVTGMSLVQLFSRQQRAYDDFEAVNRTHMVAFKDSILAYAQAADGSLLASTKRMRR